MSVNEPWNELNRAGALGLRPGLARRVLAEAARRHAQLRDNLRVMVVAGGALSLLILGAIELDARTVAPARLAEWGEVADWVQNFDH
jgi:hypothetical protein